MSYDRVSTVNYDSSWLHIQINCNCRYYRQPIRVDEIGNNFTMIIKCSDGVVCVGPSERAAELAGEARRAGISSLVTMRRNSGSSATGLRGARVRAESRKSFAHARTQRSALQCAPSGFVCAWAACTHELRLCWCLSSRSINELDIDSDCCLHATHWLTLWTWNCLFIHDEYFYFK